MGIWGQGSFSIFPCAWREAPGGSREVREEGLTLCSQAPEGTLHQTVPSDSLVPLA